MGYYTGSGVVSGGSSVTSLRATGPDYGGAFYVYNRTISRTTILNGVSLQQCRNEQGDINMDYWQWPGGRVEPASRGTMKSVSYSQINGSNLYALTITNNTIQVRGKQNTYDSGWVS